MKKQMTVFFAAATAVAGVLWWISRQPTVRKKWVAPVALSAMDTLSRALRRTLLLKSGLSLLAVTMTGFGLKKLGERI